MSKLEKGLACLGKKEMSVDNSAGRVRNIRAYLTVKSKRSLIFIFKTDI